MLHPSKNIEISKVLKHLSDESRDNDLCGRYEKILKAT